MTSLLFTVLMQELGVGKGVHVCRISSTRLAHAVFEYLLQCKLNGLFSLFRVAVTRTFISTSFTRLLHEECPKHGHNVTV